MENALSQLAETIRTLKDFQTATVERVMQNFNAVGHSQRILIADEVGLGKTIVAKGIIAKLLIDWIEKRRQGRVNRPLRVTYICSNLTLATENREKLAVFDSDSRGHYIKEPSFGRLIEVAVKPSLDDSSMLLEVCSLTPSTSFTLTQGDGNMRERYIIFQSLIALSELSAYSHQLSDLFQKDVKKTSWKAQCQWFTDSGGLDSSISDDFINCLAKKTTLETSAYTCLGLYKPTWLELLIALCQQLKKVPQSAEHTAWHYSYRVQLRALLARCCARNLKADLFILDEFQRFKALLNTQTGSEESLIAQEVFHNREGTKVLLLSATPFKAMSSVEDDESQEAHLEELRHLLKFLMKDDHELIAKYEKARKTLLNNILSLRDTDVDIDSLDPSAKKHVEHCLSPYICRTERGQISSNFDGIYKSKQYQCFDTFTESDISSYLAIVGLSDEVNKLHKGYQGHQLMEFYKSAPWPLSFMSEYTFRKRLDLYLEQPSIKKAVKQSADAWLSKGQLQSYRLNIGQQAPNAKTRSLVDLVFSDRSEELLWLPPTLPHYPLQGCFYGNEEYTKTLLFSSWALVPRALSGLLSYEAERRLLNQRRGLKKQYFKEGKSKTQPLVRFDGKAGLVGWSLVYPSKLLKELPLEIGVTGLDHLIESRTNYFEREIVKLNRFAHGENTKNRWYALASILLDQENGNQKWVSEWLDGQFKLAIAADDQKGRLVHLNRLSDCISNEHLELGPMPQDLACYLATLSISAPGVCAARMFGALWNDDTNIANCANQVGMSVIQMFNKPESIQVIRKTFKGDQYWRHILRYCAEGDIQAMFNEYGHLLKDSGMDIARVTERICEVTGFRTSGVSCQFMNKRHQVKKQDTKAGSLLRCHFAVPLGNQKSSDEQGLQRIGHVRDAFNSPFKPFVLNSTSIGQEGLDFHWYCSRVVHWNLPSNPIDIEQREGRVNRYKGLVVRRRVAETCISQPIEKPVSGDTWAALFRLANELTADRNSDLVPYWHMPTGRAQIERVVPMMPMSKEVRRLDDILKILSLYRLAFGQPRQEELINNLLHRNFSNQEIDKIKEALVINLAPIMQQEKDVTYSAINKGTYELA